MPTNGMEEPLLHSSVAMSQKVGRNPLDDSESGWVRTVHAYVLNNACGVLPYRWRLTGQQAHFLRQDESLLAKARSLGTIADQLTRRRGGSEGPPVEALQELDTIAAALLATTRLLHTEQRQLGIVTRHNVVWNGEHILLMDQGFHVPADAFPQPPWIAVPPADAAMWEVGIAVQQNKALPHPGFSPAEDVRLLVRLYQGLLLNVWQKSLVKGPDLRNVYRTRSMELWDRFRKLMEHPSADPLDDLEKVLAIYPLSSHFRSSGGRGGGDEPVKKRSMLVSFLPLLLPVMLALGLGATWLFDVWPFSPDPPVGPGGEWSVRDSLPRLSSTCRR